MFALLHENLHRDKIATHISKTTFHRWLNGGSPHLSLLSIADEVLDTNTSVAYARKFSCAAKKLFFTNETSKVIEILKVERLKKDDERLLKQHHLKRIWRNTFSVFRAKDFTDEC